jgi:hypothetical protein
MSETTPNPTNPANNAGLPPGQNPPANSPPLPPRKRKRWGLRILCGLGVLVILLVILLLLAPTIAGLGFVKSIVEGQINQNINGTVEIGSYSLGWTAGISANDVKVYDDKKTLILQLNKFSTGLSLLDAIKGNFALGDTVVDVDLVRAEIGSDGQLNYLKLLKQTAKPKSAGEHTESNPKPSASPLPPVSGKLTVNFKGTVYQGDNALVQIQPSMATVGIPDINSPITDDVTLNYSVSGGTVGTIHLAGSASAVKNNLVDVNNAAADEKLDLADVNLKALAPILQLLSPSLALQPEGIASGSLAVKATGADSLAANGQINVAKFAVSGAPLKGNDRLAIDQIAIPIDITRSTKEGQPYLDVKHADILLNGGPGGGQLGKITVAASAPQDSLISAAALVPAVMQRALLGTSPAAESLIVNGEGTATINADFDVAALASQLPATIALQQGTKLTQGHLSHRTTITISKDTARIDTDTKLPDLQGTTGGKPVQLSPIDISAGLSAVGGTTPDLRDVSFHLTSGFLNASGGGASLSQEKLTGNFDLANLQTQASQFVDLDTLLNPPTTAPSAAPATPPQHVQLAGVGTFDLSTDGDLIKPDGQGKVATSLTITGINASGIGAVPPVKLANLNATLSGNLHRGPSTIDYKNFAAVLTAGGITVSGKGPAAPPVLDNESITAIVSGEASLPTGEGPQTINLSSLQVKSSSDLFGLSTPDGGPMALSITSEKHAIKASGVISVAADLKKLYDVAQRFAAAAAAAPAVAIPVAAQPASIAQFQSGLLNGTLTLTRADQPRTDVTFDGAITHLTVTTQQQPISNETVKLTFHGTAPDDLTAIKADASLDSRFMSAKLANAILELGSTAAAKPAGPWDMLQHADINLNIPDLPAVYDLLNAFSSPVAAQASAILPQFESSQDHGGARIIATALDPADAQAPTETPLETARRHKREKAARAARATAAAQAQAQAAAAAPLPPLQITSGSMAGAITLARDVPSQTTTLNVTDLSLSKLALARGNSKYAFTRELDFKLAVAVKASDDASKPSPIAQIQQIQISQLDGDLAVGKVSMPQPIVIKNPGDASKIDAQGTLNVDGTLGAAAPLLAILQGADKPMPYGGTYALSQAIGSGRATLGNLLKLVGSITVTNFQVLGDTGKAVYTEPTVVIKNDLDYIIAKTDPAPVIDPAVADSGTTTAPTARPARSNDQAIVRSLTLDMPASQALAIKFTGRVGDPMNKRVIRGIGQDPTAKLDLTYDLAKLWPIIEPMLTPEMQAKYKTLKVVGKAERVFNVSGYFPMARTTAESIHHLNADGGFALDELDLPQGLTITKQDLPFKMTAGVVVTAPSASPQTLNANTTQPIVANTAIANQGALDLSEITLDLGQPSPVLTIAPNHKLLQGVHINPVLAGTLGEGNLLFKDATQANGLLDVTVVQCDQVPLGDLLTDAKTANASIIYSVSDLAIDGPVPQVLSSVLPLGGQGIHGGIQDGKLSLANGEVDNDFALNIIRYEQPTANGQPQTDGTAAAGTASATTTDAQGNQLVAVNLPMKFSGGVVLATGALKNFLVNVPQGLLPARWASAFPNGLSVPFTGTTSHPSLDLQKALIANAGSGLLNGASGGGNSGVGGLLNGLLNKHKKKSSDNSDSSGGQ